MADAAASNPATGRADRVDAAGRVEQRPGCRAALARADERGRERTSRSVAEILRANIFTRFNLILGVLLADLGLWRPAGCPVRPRAGQPTR